MATVFPFNKIPTIPLSVLSALLPIFLAQKKRVNKLVSKLQQKIESLPKNVSCGDAEIAALKQDLANLQQLVLNIQRIANTLQPISNALRTATTIANVLIPIQLAIPSVIGVPEGPKEQAITALAELLQNITAVLNILNLIVTTINGINNQVNNVVSLTESKINSICNDIDSDASSLNTQSELLVATNAQSALISPELNINFPSEFYQEINVSNEDLQNRIDQIQNLLNDELDVLQNLIEIPSKVLRGFGQPANNLGNIGDYYIDTDTQTVYGPKSSQNSWQ